MRVVKRGIFKPFRFFVHLRASKESEGYDTGMFQILVHVFNANVGIAR